MFKVLFYCFLSLVTTTSLTYAKNYTIGTGSQSGIYYPFGGSLAKVWSEHINDVNIKATVTAASLENTIKVAQGKMIAGFAMGNVVLDAYEGKGRFPKKMPVNVLFSAYPNLIHIITLADSGIHSISDLKGKKISLGAPGSGTAITATELLQTLGMNINKDVNVQYLNYTRTTNAIANGQIDAGFIVGGQGTGAVTQLALTKNIRILDISPKEQALFTQSHPAYSDYVIPKNVYNEVADVRTLSIWNVIVVSSQLPKKLAYQLTKTAYDHMSEIQKTVNLAKMTTPENAQQLKGVPLHPGALEYLNSIKK